MLSQSRNRGFSLVELMIVIGIIVVLMGLITFAIPLIQSLANKIKTTANLKQLKTALIRYDDNELPADTKYDNHPIDKDDLIEALKAVGVTEHTFRDGWGGEIIYDRLRNIDLVFEINEGLPSHPIKRLFPNFSSYSEMTDDEKDKIKWDFIIWSLGDPKDESDDLYETGNHAHE